MAAETEINVNNEKTILLIQGYLIHEETTSGVIYFFDSIEILNSPIDRVLFNSLNSYPYVAEGEGRA